MSRCTCETHGHCAPCRGEPSKGRRTWADTKPRRDVGPNDVGYVGYWSNMEELKASYLVRVTQTDSEDRSDCIRNAINAVDDEHYVPASAVVAMHHEDDDDEPCHDSNRDYCDVCEPTSPPFKMYDDHTYCHWCWADITYRAQYRVGKNRDGHMVCGSRCPCRPTRREGRR